MNKAIFVLITELFFLQATATPLCWENLSEKPQHTISWPEDGAIVDSSVLTKAIRSALTTLEPKRKPDVALGSVPWKGQKKIWGTPVSQRDLADRFGAEALKYHETQGRDVLDVAILTYLHLGMEQGRRDFLNHPEFQDLLLKAVNLKDMVEKEPGDLSKFMASLNQIYNTLLKIKDRAEIEIFEATRKESESYFKIQDLIESYYTLEQAQSQQLRLSLFGMSHYGRQQGVRAWYAESKRKLLSTISSIEQDSRFFSQQPALSGKDLNVLAMSLVQELVLTAAFLASN